MSKIMFADQRFNTAAMAVITEAERICTDYANQGYQLTLRQLYYRFIATDAFPESRRDPVLGTKNTERNYKWLGSLVSDGRVAGLIDWEHITDRTRTPDIEDQGWSSPESILASAAHGYRIPRWEGQPEHVECCPPEQEIITSTGLIPIAKIQEGDLVLTGQGRFRPVTRVVTHEYDGLVLTVKAAGLLPFRVTANHPVWTSHADTSRPGYKGSQRKHGSWAFGRADSLHPNDLLAVPKLAGIRPVRRIRMNTRTGRSPVPAKIIDVPWDARLQAVTGLYLAEGCIRGDRRTAQFTLGAHENENYRALRDWAAIAGITVSTAVANGARQVYLHSANLADWLHGNFGNRARDKRIPLWLLEAPGDGQIEVLRWYFRGDGSLDLSVNALTASTRSLHLAHQGALILIRNGYLPSICATQDHGEPRYQLTVSGQSGADLMTRWGYTPAPRIRRYNHMRASGNSMHAPIRSVCTEKYAGPVYNIEVADDHTFCVPSAVVHNCWVEKEALGQVIRQAAGRWDVSSFACKGSPSTSSMYDAAMRLRRHERAGRKTTVVYLGDHDPTGIDISRDIQDRLVLFRSTAFVDRIALNMDQVIALNPPPSPVKVTDSRTNGYVEQFGTDECWELDAIEPAQLDALIESAILDHLDMDLRQARMDREEHERRALTAVYENWADVLEYMRDQGYVDGEE